jgi:hypothetical protein
LGAFLKVGGRKDEGEKDAVVRVIEQVAERSDEEDFFQDNGSDNETMLCALDTQSNLQGKAQDTSSRTIQVTRPNASTMLPLPRPRIIHKPLEPVPASEAEDLSSFWDDLDSSTQIARDLDIIADDADDVASCNTSFGSGSFDFTAEELDILDPPKPAPPAAKTHPPPTPAFTTMPPPQRPAKRSPISIRSIPPHQLFQHAPDQQPKCQNAIRGPFLPARSLYCSPDLGFTLTQLESFVDDDLQLTQTMPG